MKKYRILLVNDDGPESPILAPFLEELSKADFCQELSYIIPAEEQSWCGTSITRLRPVYQKDHSIGDINGSLVTGTPSDCVHIGALRNQNQQPELILSGINMGSNSGLPFFLHSGTVAGALAASLLGFPAVALSAGSSEEIHQAWVARDKDRFKELEQDWKRIAQAAVSCVSRILNAKILGDADFYSVNLPWTATNKSPLIPSYLKRGQLGPVFQEQEKGLFRHRFNGLSFDASNPSPTDVDTEQAGQISITPISISTYQGNPEKIAEKLARTEQG